MPSKLLYIMLIASLPFFSVVRFSGNMSAPFVALSIIFLVLCYKTIRDLRLHRAFNLIDELIFIYLLVCIFSLLYSGQENGLFALLKSATYFILYLSLKNFLANQELSGLINSSIMGVIAGTVFFSLSVIYVLIIKGIPITSLQGFSYQVVTVQIFRAIAEQLGNQNIESSADVMRSALGEVFALYVIIMIIFIGVRQHTLGLLMTILNMLFLFSMSSRRALIAVAITIFGLFLRKGMRVRNIAALGAGLIVIAGMILSYQYFVGDSRLFELSDTSRMQQYEHVVSLIADKPILGYGYGAKTKGDVYVHNFILASFFMNGVLGLVVSLGIYLFLCFEYMRWVIRRSDNVFSALLIIPVIGLTIGSTVEGMLTITGWIAVALYGLGQKKRREGVHRSHDFSWKT